jgi:hypothetical protein
LSACLAAPVYLVRRSGLARRTFIPSRSPQESAPVRIVPLRPHLGSLLLALTSLAALVGCGGPGNVGRVTGKVTLDGQPLPDAMVTFSPTKAGGSSALGKTDSTGAYTLSYSAGVSGAEIGENRVTISTLPQGKEQVPMEYNTQTKLKAEVKAGANSFDWDLKGGGPIYSPAPPPGKKKK